MQASVSGAIDAFTRDEAAQIRRHLDLSDRNLLVDVAGGRGTLLRELLQGVPRARGILFDVEHVIEAVRPQLPERIEAVAGDMFAGVPPDGDVYLIARWNNQVSRYDGVTGAHIAS